METTEIIKTILDKEGLTVRAFALSINQPYPSVYDVSVGRVKTISRKLAHKILAVYPHYNFKWLMGESEVVLSDNHSISDSESSDYELLEEDELKEVLSNSGRMIPVNIARIPNFELESTVNKLNIPYRNPSDYMPKYDFMYRVLSNAMEPALFTGDIIFIQKSFEKRVINGDCYLLDTMPLGTIVRKVIDQGESILCLAINNDCEALLLEKKEIFDIYAIVAILRFNANIHLDDSQSIKKELSIRDKQIDALINSVNKLIAEQDKLITQNQEVFNLNKKLIEELLNRK